MIGQTTTNCSYLTLLNPPRSQYVIDDNCASLETNFAIPTKEFIKPVTTIPLNNNDTEKLTPLNNLATNDVIITANIPPTNEN